MYFGKIIIAHVMLVSSLWLTQRFVSGCVCVYRLKTPHGCVKNVCGCVRQIGDPDRKAFNLVEKKSSFCSLMHFQHRVIQHVKLLLASSPALNKCCTFIGSEKPNSWWHFVGGWSVHSLCEIYKLNSGQSSHRALFGATKLHLTGSSITPLFKYTVMTDEPAFVWGTSPTESNSPKVFISPEFIQHTHHI